MNIDHMTSSELTNYITRDGKVFVDIKRLAEAIHKGKIKKVVLSNGQEINLTTKTSFADDIERVRMILQMNL